MSPIYYSNEWADTNIYFTIGKSICNGKILYTDVFDHKGPFIFFIYALGYLISNESFMGMFIIEVVGWFIMALAIYKMSRLYLSEVNSYFVAIIFPIFLVKLMKAGGSAEEFILIFECVSFYYFLKYLKEKDASIHKPYFMLIHGVMCSLVLFTKLNLIMLWFFPIAGIFINLLLHKEFKNIIINLIAYIAGILVVAIPICLYLYTNDALHEAYAIYIDLNRKYASIDSLGETIELLLVRISLLYFEPLSLLIMATIGIYYFPIKYIDNKIGKWAFVLSGLTLYIVIFMSNVFQHYYPISYLLFSALGLIGIFLFIGKYVETKQVSFKYILVISVILNYAGVSQKDLLDTKLARVLTDENAGLLTQRMHNIIVQEKNPTLLNLGFGLGNSLFTTCNIIPNIRYFVSPNLTYESYPNLRDEQTKYIENKETQFIVTQKPGKDFHFVSMLSKRRKINNIEYFDSLPAFKENYSLVLSDTIVNTIDENSFEIYNLYKRND